MINLQTFAKTDNVYFWVYLLLLYSFIQILRYLNSDLDINPAVKRFQKLKTFPIKQFVGRIWKLIRIRFFWPWRSSAFPRANEDDHPLLAALINLVLFTRSSAGLQISRKGKREEQKKNRRSRTTRNPVTAWRYWFSFPVTIVPNLDHAKPL